MGPGKGLFVTFCVSRLQGEGAGAVWAQEEGTQTQNFPPEGNLAQPQQPLLGPLAPAQLGAF